MHERFNAALGSEGALDLPSKAIDLAEGRAIYEKGCASCHGSLGRGDGPAARGMTPPAPAIGTVDAMHAVTPALMYRIVSVGVAGTPMAGWADRLSADERWNVVAYVNTMRSSAGQVAEGEGLYTQRCASCHGATGADDGPSASMLSSFRELGSFAWQAERSDSDIAQAIRGGMTATAMPASRDLTDGELTAMVAYVRSLAAKQPPRPTLATRKGSDGWRHRAR